MIFFRNAKGILLTLHLLADIQSGICSKTIYIYILTANHISNCTFSSHVRAGFPAVLFISIVMSAHPLPISRVRCVIWCQLTFISTSVSTKRLMVAVKNVLSVDGQRQHGDQWSRRGRRGARRRQRQQGANAFYPLDPTKSHCSTPRDTGEAAQFHQSNTTPLVCVCVHVLYAWMYVCAVYFSASCPFPIMCQLISLSKG